MSRKADSSTFAKSAHLSFLHSPAPVQAIAAEVSKLLAILGENDPALVDALTKAAVPLGMLVELRMWNERLITNPRCDRLGQAARLFWAAQTLVTTVMRSSALNQDATYPESLARALARAADGLFDVGQSQFEALALIANDIVNWLVAHNARSVALIESPLGNSVPVQVIGDLVAKRGIEVATILWNAPRNDRPSRGRTIEQSASDCADEAREHDYVILVDEVFHGSRFIKLLEALQARIDAEKFIPVAMMFKDSFRASVAASLDRPRLIEKLEQHHRATGFPTPVREMPTLRLFKIDDGNPVRWEAPVIWGDSDMVPGKRKVNLIFMIIDHCFELLEDLGKDQSHYRRYLERAWSRDTEGTEVVFAPGVTQRCFAGIAADLPIKELRDRIWEMARARFPDDYTGNIQAIGPDGVTERWRWFGETFLDEAKKRIDEKRAGTAWRAIDDGFAASFPDRKPRARRDLDAAPYIIPFNKTIQAFNIRLRQRIAEFALQHKSDTSL